MSTLSANAGGGGVRPVAVALAVGVPLAAGAAPGTGHFEPVRLPLQAPGTFPGALTAHAAIALVLFHALPFSITPELRVGPGYFHCCNGDSACQLNISQAAFAAMRARCGVVS